MQIMQYIIAIIISIFQVQILYKKSKLKTLFVS